MTDPARLTRLATLAAPAALAILLAAPALAQDYAPTPRASPRTPVNREFLNEGRGAVARDVQGQAVVIDGDKLKIGAADLRLFGVVPPSLSANFGPQARTLLDNLTTNQLTDCRVRDRDRDGRLLATCHTAAGADLALELLRRGLAVTARGSLAETELASVYLAAEQAAQAQHLGLWSATAPPPASAAAVNDSAKADLRVAAAEASAASLPPSPAPALIVPASPPGLAPPPSPDELRREDKTAKALDARNLEKALAADPVTPPPATAIPPVSVSQLGPGADEMTLPPAGFFARYQILLACLLMLVTAAGILITLSFQRRSERREEMKAIAAALRGELMAMRAVCQTRLKMIGPDTDDHVITWPKLRSTLYQAYVGRIGALGAELARQIAAIYGQSSDYAAYYSSLDDARMTATPKKQALQMLCAYIEEVLPRLASIEQTGHRPQQFTHPQNFMPEAPRASRLPVPQTYRQPRPVPAIEPQRSRSLTVMPEAEASTAVTPPAPPAAPPPASYVPGATAKLWDSLRHFARAQFGEKAMTDEDGIGDYTSLIEQDMANLSFGDDEPPGELLNPQRTPKRGNGA